VTTEAIFVEGLAARNLANPLDVLAQALRAVSAGRDVRRPPEVRPGATLAAGAPGATSRSLAAQVRAPRLSRRARASDFREARPTSAGVMRYPSGTRALMLPAAVPCCALSHDRTGSFRHGKSPLRFALIRASTSMALIEKSTVNEAARVPRKVQDDRVRDIGRGMAPAHARFDCGSVRKRSDAERPDTVARILAPGNSRLTHALICEPQCGSCQKPVRRGLGREPGLCGLSGHDRVPACPPPLEAS
jgi:hypothetical protein